MNPGVTTPGPGAGRLRPARLLIAPIRFYQRNISPSLPATCRYYPTCSAYAVEALQLHGMVRGLWLTLRRLGRCQPWSRHDHHDPVPPARTHRTAVTGPREPDGPLSSSPSGSHTLASTPVGSSLA